MSIELDFNNPPESFIRVTKDAPIPKYLVSASADVSYDFCDATYFLYHKFLERIVFAVHIVGQQSPKEFNESAWLWEYHCSPDWFVLSTIDSYLSLYKIDNAKPELLIESKEIEEHNLRINKVS